MSVSSVVTNTLKPPIHQICSNIQFCCEIELGDIVACWHAILIVRPLYSNARGVDSISVTIFTSNKCVEIVLSIFQDQEIERKML